MSRHMLFPAAALFAVCATQPAAADTCTFESSGAVGSTAGPNAGSVFEIDDFSFDIEQTLNIGSQSSGAGKVTFNPFQITKKIDSATPILFQSAVTGAAFREIKCSFYSSDASNGASSPYLSATLSNAIVSKFKVEGTADGTPRVKFWFRYEKIEWRY
jgi:type VI secretion system secreted protein Hcp